MERETGEVTKGSLAGQPNDTTTADDASRINERLKKFVKSFVEEFENKMKEYSKEIKVGVKTQKAGKIADSLAGGVSAGVAAGVAKGVEEASDVLGIVVGPTKAIQSATQSLFREGATYLGRRSHRQKAKKCIAAITSLQENEAELRKIIAAASFDIFQNFEEQFTEITDTEGSWRRGIEKLARDAVNRAMNYFDRHPERVVITSAFLTKVVILGESKKGIGARLSWSKPGHTIKSEKMKETIKTSELFSRTGIMKVGHGVVEYYKKKDDDIEKFGYRLAFNWELEKCEQEFTQEYGIGEKPSGHEYKYIIKAENKEEMLLAILKEIDDKDQMKVMKRTDEVSADTNQTVKGMDEQLTGLVNDVKTLLIKNNIKESVSFNVSDPVESFTGRKEELERLHCLVQESSENVTVISRIIIIAGLGGVGKTQLARQYIHEYCENYNNILWMNAENDETLTESFLKLAGDKRVNISRKDVNAMEKDMQSIVNEVYRFFADGRSLFIFDNAEKYSMQQEQDPRNNGIVTYLPSSVKEYAEKPCFIITTRNQKWPEGVQTLQLKVFSKEDATDFIRKALKKDHRQDNNEIDRLAETLQYLPLTLQQSVAYIRITNEKLSITGCTFDINDYLKRYEEVTKALLGFKFTDSSSDSHFQTTLTTWKVTIDKIRDNSEHIPALNILDIIAYIAPDNIPAEMFLRLEYINSDREKLGEAIQPLVQYSMIHSGEQRSLLNAHRLVQQVTRIKLGEEKRNEDVISITFELLKKNFFSHSDELEDNAMKRQLLPHLEVFLTHVDQWSVKKPEDKQQIETRYTAQILQLLCEGYYAVRNFRRQMELLLRVLALEEKYLGSDHFTVAFTLENLGNAYGFLGNPQKGRELLERALAIKKKHYGVHHSEVARTLTYLGSIYGSLGDVHKQKELLESSLKIGEEHYGLEHLELVHTLTNLGNAYSSVGSYQKQKDSLERALAIMVKHYGPDHFEVVNILTNLGNAYGSLGDPQKQKELLERALEIRDDHYGPDHFEAAYTLINLGNAYSSLGDPQKQKHLLERALAIQENYYGPNHFEVAKALTNLGNAHGSLGDPQKQKELLETALAIKEKHYGPDHFEVAITLTSLSNAYGSLGDPQTKMELLERALDINQKHYGLDHCEVAITLTNLGNAYGSLGDPQTKKEFLERALAIQEKCYGSDHFEVANILTNLGNDYNSLGDHQTSKELLERALAIQTKHYGPDHFIVAVTLTNLGNLFGYLGDPRKHKALLERALAINEKHYGPDHFAVANVLTNLSNAYGFSGDHQKRKELLEHVLKIQEKHYGHDHFEIANTLTRLSNAYASLGNLQKQKELLERALTIEERHCGLEHHELVSFTLESLGHVCGELGNHEGAFELYQRSSNITDMQTPLHLATRNGNLKTVEYIIGRGADVIGRNSHDTVLHSAVCNSNIDVIRLVLDKVKEKYPQNFSEHIDAKDNEGDTPLMWAAQAGKVNTVKILLEYGADLNVRNKHNETSLQWAEKGGHQEIMELLFEHQVNHSIEDEDEQITSDLVEGNLPLLTANEKFKTSDCKSYC